LSGLQVGRVRVIFSLPEKHLHRLFPASISPPTHLAYVEWFSKFRSRPDDHTGLYHIKPLLKRDKTRAVSVIPLDRIKQSVHLTPKWGGTVPSNWTYENTLDLCSSFFLNSFTNTHMYFNMQ
ncbi:hypothetical protein EV360DRAFT_56667, partial [Lentinula raphanica]